MRFRLAVALLALTVTACATVTPTSAAPCENAGLRTTQGEDRHARLVAAFVSNVADVASWQSTGYGQGTLRVRTVPASGSRAPLERVDVCWYEGSFDVGGHPFLPAGAATSRPWDLLLVLVDADGSARIATAGYRETTPPASPAHGP